MNLKSRIRSSIVFAVLGIGSMDCPGPLSAAAYGDPARSVTIPSGYWQGELLAPGRSWKLALDVDASRADTVLLDMPSQLREIYGGQGVDGSGETIAYCRIGERSSHTWFVLNELLGLENVKNYDGSWTEYGSLVNAPVERDV